MPGSHDRFQRRQPTIPYAKLLRLLLSESHTSGPAKGHERDAPCPTNGNWSNHLDSRSWWFASSLRTSRRLTDESKTSRRDVLSNPIRLDQACCDDRSPCTVSESCIEKDGSITGSGLRGLDSSWQNGWFCRAPKNSPMEFPRCTVVSPKNFQGKCESATKGVLKMEQG